MKKYLIEQTASGHVFGIYSGQTEDEAYQAMCRDANAEGQERHPELVVLEVESVISVPKTARSSDETVSLPDEIQLLVNGKAIACHYSDGSRGYKSLGHLCEAYDLDEDEVRAWV